MPPNKSKPKGFLEPPGRGVGGDSERPPDSEVDIRADDSLDYAEAVSWVPAAKAPGTGGLGFELKTMSTHGKRRQQADQGVPNTAVQPGTDALAARGVLDWLRTALLEGRPWSRTLLEAIGRWPLAEEKVEGVRYQYLLLGEAFDWLVLAGRILPEVDGLIPDEEKDTLLFQGRLPEDVPETEFRNLLGPEKYSAHLNYFYGVVVEESLLLAVEEEIRKERRSHGLPDSEDIVEVAHHQLYGDTREALLSAFRQELGRPQSPSISSLTELKEFTYWAFKRRVNSADSARVASDTKKGLERLFRMNGA